MDGPKALKYDYTYKPPGSVFPPAAARSPIDDALRPGERVLWSGQPPQGLIVLRLQDLALVPFFVAWTGFALFWEAMAIGTLFIDGGGVAGPGLCMSLFGLPFVAIGLYMLGGRFVADVPLRRSTHYALTDQRAMIVSGARNRRVTSIPLGKVENLDLVLHRDGTGTLTFTGKAKTKMAGGSSYNGATGYSYNVPAFDHIRDPKRVYDLVLKAQDDLTVRQHGYTPESRSDDR